MSLMFPRWLLLTLATVSATPALARPWTLESSIRQAVCASPELRKSLAGIRAREEDARLAGLWPDPEIEVRIDNQLGKDDRSGGYDVTDVTLTQAIPLARIGTERAVAEAELAVAARTREHKALLLQNRIARAFHALQFASARLALAGKQRQLAGEISRPTRRNDQGTIVRYLTPLEKVRLRIILEEANQEEINAEGKYREALTRFSRLIGVAPGQVASIAALRGIGKLPAFDTLSTSQSQHVELDAQQQRLLAATRRIELARRSYMKDPSVSLIRSRDTFDNGRDDVYGVMFNVQIPLQGRKSALVGKARYDASQQRIELARLRRELEINLKASYTHLNHLHEQAVNFQKKVLEPAREILELTRRGFNSGELNVLALVDANRTYFDARIKYLELLYQARSELADVRLYAGQPVAGVGLEADCAAEGGQ